MRVLSPRCARRRIERWFCDRRSVLRRALFASILVCCCDLVCHWHRSRTRAQFIAFAHFCPCVLLFTPIFLCARHSCSGGHRAVLGVLSAHGRAARQQAHRRPDPRRIAQVVTSVACTCSSPSGLAGVALFSSGFSVVAGLPALSCLSLRPSCLLLLPPLSLKPAAPSWP